MRGKMVCVKASFLRRGGSHSFQTDAVSPFSLSPDNNNIWPRVTKPIRSHTLMNRSYHPPYCAAAMVQPAERGREREAGRTKEVHISIVVKGDNWRKKGSQRVGN
ncbi:hypothetical protein AMECASPLE_012481 [Ameca splendens]|uniref:Uncharacterized protein n=1 Tax=Ameca splendens TaxID=208324 RepID=A0ABV1AA11_9TELE